MSSHLALTAKYRPQSFAELAGQDMLSSILSRASSENRIAPAYLFSGTRGVGKTTVARIFAKALNCETAPTAEPCNQCEQCRKITQGLAVDVVEIDGASNRGIDDIRKLKESVGYAPMEGRYKVFIIDEAHMLSREAFNALLKTLEEPPARVTFILATTEPHKFPATILSRCQHYVFKRLSNKALEAHLQSVLQREGAAFEAGAVRLVAERGAGSVRDSMSLLGQVLALGSAELTEAGVRSVLGLAGQEIFLQLLSAIEAEDCPAILNIVNDLLDQGLDLGFFLRELGSIWRNLFILRQSGQAALSVLGLSGEEGKTWLEMAGRFSPAHIHASWQMILDGQRRVLNSLEPALSLEHLLLNLALLSRLLPLEQYGKISGGKANPAQTPTGTPGSNVPIVHGSMGGQGQHNTHASPAGEEKKNYSIASESLTTPAADIAPRQPSRQGSFQRAEEDQGWQEEDPFPEAPDDFAYAEPDYLPGRSGAVADASGNISGNSLGNSQANSAGNTFGSSSGNSVSGSFADPSPTAAHHFSERASANNYSPPAPNSSTADFSATQPLTPETTFDLDQQQQTHPDPNHQAGAKLDWEAFLRYSLTQPDLPHSFMPCLRSCNGMWSNPENAEPELTVSSESAFNYERLSDKEFKAILASLVKSFAGESAGLKLELVESLRLSPMEIKQRFEEHGGVKALREEFQARLVDWGTIKTRR